MSEERFVDAGVLSDSPQDLASRLDNMMNMIVAHSQRVNAHAEMVHHHEEAPSTSQLRPQVKRRKATPPDLHVQDFPIDQGARQRLKKRLKKRLR